MTKRMEEINRHQVKTNLLKAAIVNGICNAQDAGYTKPYDIALSVESVIKNFLNVSLIPDTNLRPSDARTIARKALERYDGQN